MRVVDFEGTHCCVSINLGAKCIGKAVSKKELQGSFWFSQGVFLNLMCGSTLFPLCN